MITLIDRDGDTVKMTKEEIAHCLRMMGNPPGWYRLLGKGLQPEDLERDVIQFRVEGEPHYTLWSKIKRVFRRSKERVWVHLKGRNSIFIRL